MQITLGQSKITITYNFVYQSIWSPQIFFYKNHVFTDLQSSMECRGISVGQPNCTY